MSAEGARRRELAELVPDHVLGHEDRDVLAAVVHRDGVAEHLRDDIQPWTNALSSTTWSFNLAVGSAVGGIVAVAFGRNTVFTVNAISFIASALLIARMKFDEPHLKNLPGMRARDLADFTPALEGIRYVTKDRRLLITLFVKCGLGLMGASWVIVPILGERVFPVMAGGLSAQRGGMLGMSLLMASRGVGSLIGPLISNYLMGSQPARLRLGILGGFVAGCIGYLILGPIVDFIANNMFIVRFVAAVTAILLMTVPTAFVIIYLELKVIARQLLAEAGDHLALKPVVERLGFDCVPRGVVSMVLTVPQRPAHVRLVGFGPPSVQLRQIETSIDEHFHTARPTGFPRAPGRVDPDVDPLHQVLGQEHVVVA